MQPNDLVTAYFRLSEPHRQALGKLGITTIYDLLHHFPSRFEAAGSESAIAGLELGMDAAVTGVLEKLETKNRGSGASQFQKGTSATPVGA